MLPAIIATTVTTPDATRGYTVLAGGLDVTGDTQWDSLLIQNAGGEGKSITSLRINRNLVDVPEVRDQSVLEITDHRDGDSLAFRGFIDDRHPARVPAFGYVDISATDHSTILDNAISPQKRIRAESDRARIGFLWGHYATRYLSGDLSFVQQVRAAMPPQYFDGVTLAEALDMIAAQASTAAWWYLDTAGRLHYGATETNNAPKNVTSDTPGGGEVAPQDLDIDYESSGYVQSVFVRGKTVAGTGWVRSQSLLGSTGMLVRAAFLDAPDCSTAAMRDALGNMFLGRVSQSHLRGSFTVNSTDADGWRAGQKVTVRSSHMTISSVSYRIVSVQTKVLGPYQGITSAMREYRVEFNRRRRSVK